MILQERLWNSQAIWLKLDRYTKGKVEAFICMVYQHESIVIA